MATTKVIDLPILIPGMPLTLGLPNGATTVYELDETDVAVAFVAETGQVFDVAQSLETLRTMATDTDLVFVCLTQDAQDVLDYERAVYADCFGATFPG